jgi:signal peptidase II
MSGGRKVGLGRQLLFWSIALGGTSFDLVTKSLAFSKVGPPGSPKKAVISNILELHTSFNTGALWGFGSKIPGSSMIFAGLSVVAACVICYYLFVLGAASSKVLTVALGLIMAGALGNCYDRLLLGHVRDFVHLHVDPIGFDCAIFNFADNMLIAGAITLVIFALAPDHSTPQSPEPVALGDDDARDGASPDEPPSQAHTASLVSAPSSHGAGSI